MSRASINSLPEKLRARIASNGPITFHDWMTAALYDPEHGYYCAPDRMRWGRQGDYRTSPERSALFSATFARYFAKLCSRIEEPNPTLLECGAGGGHFAAGCLGEFAVQFPSLYSSAHFVINDVSCVGREPIPDRLSQFSDKVSFSSLEQLPPFAGIVFANELLDALPVHRVRFSKGELRESYVGLTAKDEFEWRVGPLSDGRIGQRLEQLDVELIEGQIAEVNLGAETWLSQIANKLIRGFVVLVDYGAEAEDLFSRHRPNGSLRSFHRHKFVDNVLSEPGRFDITATVNWTAVRQASEALGYRMVQFEKQDKFLVSEGLLEQLELMLERAVDDVEKARLRIEAREMMLPGGMSDSFQVLVLSRGLTPS